MLLSPSGQHQAAAQWNTVVAVSCVEHLVLQSPSAIQRHNIAKEHSNKERKQYCTHIYNRIWILKRRQLSNKLVKRQMGGPKGSAMAEQ